MVEGQSQLQALQQNLEEVRVITQENLIKAGERGEKLEDLDMRAEALHKSSFRFQKTARKLRQKHEKESVCCKHWKIFTGLGVALVILSIIIIVIFAK